MAEYTGEILEKRQPEITKRTIKDSVFTDLFQEKKYLLQLYQAIHPEDTDVTPDELTDITIKNVLTISLSQEFFSGQECCIEVKVKMIYDGKQGDIINQYVVFTKVCNEQIAKHGRTRNAILETIRICKDENVLREYLESREKEVVDIMMILYDEQEIVRSYIESEVYDAQIETARRMLERGKLTVEEIAEDFDLPIEVVKDLAKGLKKT